MPYPIGLPSLASVLALQPLDRVQINSQIELAEIRSWNRQHCTALDQPFYYFQRVVGNMLEVRSPGGCALLITPVDVCDLIRGTPIEVMAMPQSLFLAKSRQPLLADRGLSVDERWYRPALVLWASKDKWGNSDFRVLFRDDSLNTSASWIAPILPADRQRVEKFVRRTVMPVSNYRSSASHSADHGIRSAQDVCRRATQRFFQAALLPGPA